MGLAGRRSPRIVYRRLLLGILISVAAAKKAAEETVIAAARSRALLPLTEKRKGVVAKELRLRGRWPDNINGGYAGKTRGRPNGRPDQAERNSVTPNHAQPAGPAPARTPTL